MAINLPNILTVTRILLTPLFVIFLLRDMFGFALLVFTVSAVSDALDGLLARYFDQRTELGAYLDPIADKLLMTSAYVSLAVLKIVPSWLTVIVISRDVLIALGFVMFTLTNRRMEVHPSPVSKCTTAAQLTCVILILLDTQLARLESVIPVLYWVVAVLTITSGLHYLYIGLNFLQSFNASDRP